MKSTVFSKYFVFLWSMFFAVGIAANAHAGSVDIPNTFTAGETAKASEVNDNFSAIETAVDDNDSRITTNALNISDNSTTITDHETRITRNEEDIDAGCPANMVKAGPLCVDMYEASVWDSSDGTGTQYGGSSDDYPCSDNGNDCSDTAQPSKLIYAVSKSDVIPSRYITWFQAQQACANSGKRLLTNAEWQMAAAGTPDDDPSFSCNLGGAVAATGNFSGCVSNWGAYDMVGNLWEWVADWMQNNSGADNGYVSTPTYGNDFIRGIDETYPEGDRFPGALIRGGDASDRSGAGVFALETYYAPSAWVSIIGFRCAR